MTDNVKPLFGGQAGDSSKRDEALRSLERAIAKIEDSGATFEGAVIFVYGNKPGAEVTRVVWSMDDGPTVRHTVAYAAAAIMEQAIS